jgi:hypothetical protein
MIRTNCTIFAALAALALSSTTALAQDETTDGTEGTTTEEASAPVESSPPVESAPMSAEGGAFAWGKGTMGIGTTFPTGGAPFANAVWMASESVGYEVFLGFDFVHTDEEDPITGNTDTVGALLGFGYRMYKPLSGRVRPYIEPALVLSIPDFSEAGDTISVGVAGLMGVEVEVVPQFSLGTGIGATLDFTNKFKDIDFGLLTLAFNGTIWWN